MSTDDLSKPLGVDRPASRSRLPFTVSQVLMALAAGGAVSLAGFILFKGDKLGGEPHVVAKIERPVATSSARVSAAEPAAKEAEAAHADSGKVRETASELEDQAGVRVVRGRSGSAPGAVVIRVPDSAENNRVKLAAAPDKRLFEKGRHGPLPRIAADGDRPSEIYARPFDSAKAAGKPKISVLLTGLGIGASVTADATAKLPGEVSFAFAPYGSDLEKMVARARDVGHEVLLQLPMEPFDFPENDPGPQTLLADAPEAQNLDRLHWLMGRFQGYAGLTNFMGARLSTSRKGLKPILTEAAKRGLIFVDDGAAGRSQIVEAAGEVGLPAARGDVVLDGIDKAAAFDAALNRAETLARANGRVIVMGPALPMTVERLGRWLKGLEQKGFVLAPVTAQLAVKKG